VRERVSQRCRQCSTRWTTWVGDVAKIALYLAAAYLGYGFAYMGADYFAGRQNSPCKYHRSFFRVMMYLVILVIALLHVLQYLMSAGGVVHA
jgi:hypothetical protein